MVRGSVWKSAAARFRGFPRIAIKLSKSGVKTDGPHRHWARWPHRNSIRVVPLPSRSKRCAGRWVARRDGDSRILR